MLTVVLFCASAFWTSNISVAQNDTTHKAAAQVDGQVTAPPEADQFLATVRRSKPEAANHS